MRVDRDELQRRIRAAERAYERCVLCPRRCAVDRSRARAGLCDLGPGATIYKEYLHFGEEAHIVPTHAVFLTGCNMRCVFCTDDPWIRDTSLGRPLVPEELAATIARRRAEGARNVSFVGGLPDVNVLAILRTLALCPPDTRVVWNTNLLVTPELIDLIDGVVDVWLADLKFGDDRCALRLSGVKGYLGVLHPMLRRVAGKGELLIRHLVMPGHLDCCTAPALAWVARELPDATLNLMTRYVPYARARTMPGLSRRTSREDAARAVDLLRATGHGRVLVDGVPPR